ncbi:MAG: S9 family peptidase [Pseudomonadota bacterium]
MNDMQSLPLIPRRTLFGNPEMASAKVSPDGKWLSWLAPVNNVLNVWVAPLENPKQAQAITADTKRGIRFYDWAANSTYIIYIQDKDGDEDWHLHSVDIATKKALDLTPYEKITARIIARSWSFPNILHVGLNNDNPSWHDVYSIDITTGESKLGFKNDQELSGFIYDRELNLKFVTKTTPDEGGTTVLRHDNGELEEMFRISLEDSLTTSLIGFQNQSSLCYFLDSRGRDKAALTTLNFESGEQKVIAESSKADIQNLLMHPTRYNIEAYSANFITEDWTLLDATIADDFEFLQSSLPGEVHVNSRTKEDDIWIITSSSADIPGDYFCYQRSEKRLEKLFSTRPDLDDAPLRPMQGHVIKSRDGLDLVSYLTLPKEASLHGEDVHDAKTVPLVLLVHGGPWARDHYGYNPQHQWLADRGYAVLSVNFRGSTGFGKAFINASNCEWAAKMHDDLLDAVNWALDNGITEKDKIAIMGGSYGGYATLVGLAFTPDVFACGIDIVGPSNLETLLETIPPYWKAFFEQLASRVGDPRTEEGIALLKQRSPLNKVEHITKPLLIGQGANDPRVKKAESDQIVEAMQNKAIPVTYVLYPDEGHGFARPENRMAFQAISEAFLAEHLGGQYEPIGDDFSGSTTQVLEGKKQIPGLSEALANVLS